MKLFAYSMVALYVIVVVCIFLSPDSQIAIGTGATYIFKPIFRSLIELINVPAFVYVMATVIFCAGVASCVTYWLWVARPRMRQLLSARNAIKGLPNASTQNQNGTAHWEETQRKLGAILRRHALLVSAWASFQSIAARTGQVPEEPFAHFVDAAPPRIRERGGLMAALPGYFTTVGLIFTFVGLVVALYFAAKGFRSGNVQDAHDSIVKLLNAASFKFLTSVAALVSALMISLTLRISQLSYSQSMQGAVEQIDVLVADWRAKLGAGSDLVRRSGPSVDQRLAAVLDAVEALTRRLDTLLQRTNVVHPREHALADG